MRVLLVSEVYPPRAGGAGWSTRALALGLKQAGHEVSVLTTSPGPPHDTGVAVKRLTATGRRRLAVPRSFARTLHGLESTVFHAQHSLSALGCLAGDHRSRVAVTVRDHWPVCFWSTRISRGAVCPRCGVVPMTGCVDGRVPTRSPLSWGAIPYMIADLSEKRRALHQAGATIAVSKAIAAELEGVGIPRLTTIPNVVDAAETRAVADGEPSFCLPERFLLFVGKLEENKGARLLVPAVAAAQTRLPVVVLGEGSLGHTLKFEAAHQGIELIVRGWAERDDVLRAMARATVLVFPSLWAEPLSRVLLDALAVGTPIAAMDTGGTREILGEGECGLLTPDVEGLGDAVGRLAADETLRTRTAEAARARARAFSPDLLVPRYEAVYRRLL